MKKRIHFSVIIPFYNASNVIRNSINSIQIQSYKYLEVIFINDGSTDDSEEIVKSHHFNVPCKLIKQNNRGQASARNEGINIAQSEYIAFLDADDIWYSNKLEKMAELICSYGGDIICHDELIISKDKEVGIARCGPHDTFNDLFFKRNCLSPSSTIVKRDLLFEVGLFDENENLRGVEDYDLWLKIAQNNSTFKFHNIVLGKYVLHGNNEIYKPGYVKKRIFLSEKYYAELKKNDDYEIPKKILIRRIRFYFRISLEQLRNWRISGTINYGLLFVYFSFCLMVLGIKNKINNGH
jgi:glycosyltransferase involved in cell wall biosynthesis